MLKVNKYIKIAIVVVVVLIMLGISIWITSIINNNSYDINEIGEWVEETTVPTEAINAEDAMKENTPKAIEDLRNLNREDLSDGEYAVQCALAILLNGPFESDVSGSEYEVKKVEDFWVVQFVCKSYTLFVQVDDTYFQPLVFTLTREFTKEEKMFFATLGSAREVQGENGTYSIYFV